MARALYTVKPTDPGQEITVDGTTYTIWSTGPQPSSVWAFDADGHWAVVKLRKGQPAGIAVAYPDSSPNAPLHTALRIHRGELALYRTREVQPYGGTVAITHADPACPHASANREPAPAAVAHYVADLIQRGERVYGFSVCGCVYH